MWKKWIGQSWEQAPMIVVSVVVVYVVLLLLIRARGLRSLTKMSPGDFVTTVALGSIFASTVVTSDPNLLMSGVAMCTIFAVQTLFSTLRYRVPWVQPVVHNAPLLIMKDGEIFYDRLKKTNITEEDLKAKLRAANVFTRQQVKAVVVEATGDLSVLHGEDDLDMWLLEGVVQ